MTQEVAVRAAQHECERFMASCKAFLKTKQTNGKFPVPSDKRATMRRASLDLTRALSALRQTGSWS